MACRRIEARGGDRGAGGRVGQQGALPAVPDQEAARRL